MNDIEVLKKAGLYIEERKPNYYLCFWIVLLFGEAVGIILVFLILLGV